MKTYQSLVAAPQSDNATVDIIREYFNAYLMHKIFVEYLVGLDVSGLVISDWVTDSKAHAIHNGFKDLLSVLKYNIKKLAQLVSCISIINFYI